MKLEANYATHIFSTLHGVTSIDKACVKTPGNLIGLK
jgi:hypothetical protein